MRSFWYGRSSQNHATGAIAATPPNAAPNHHHGRPARNSANAPLTRDQHRGAEVGLQQDQAGRHADDHRGHQHRAEARRQRPALRYQATIIGRLSFSSSAGWK